MILSDSERMNCNVDCEIYRGFCNALNLPILKKNTNHDFTFLLNVFTLAVQKLLEPHLLSTVLRSLKHWRHFAQGAFHINTAVDIWSFLKQKRYKGELGHFSDVFFSFFFQGIFLSAAKNKSTVFEQLHRLTSKKNLTISSKTFCVHFSVVKIPSKRLLRDVEWLKRCF